MTRIAKACRSAVSLVVAVCLMMFAVTANAAVTESKRGIPLTDSKVSGQAGGTETRSWADLYSASLYHYVYAVQDGVYVTSGSVAPGRNASTISGFGSWDISNDDALGGPVKNGSCYPSWYINKRCGKPYYRNYPLAG